MNNNRTLLISILGAVIIAAAIVTGVYYVNNLPSNFITSSQGQQALDSFNGNDLDNSIKLSSDAVSQNQNDIDAKLLLATSYVQKGSLTYDENDYGQKALDLTNQIIGLDPQNSEAYRIKGYSYEIMQNYPDAMTAYNEAITLNPASAAAYNSRGHAYELQGDYTDAEADYKKAISLDPSLDQANLNLGRLYMKQEDPADAKPIFTALLANKGQNVLIDAEANANLGLIAEANKDPRGAKSYFDAALSMNPDSPTLIVQSAGADMAFEVSSTSTISYDFIQATASKISSALTIDPNLSSGYETLGRLFLAIGDKTSAKQAFSQGLAVVPNDITLDASAKALMKTQITSELKAIK